MTIQSGMALMAAGSYWDIRSDDRPNTPRDESNRAPLPEGWRVVDRFNTPGSGPNATTGFSARVYENIATREIVISFAGTEFSFDSIAGISWPSAGLLADFFRGNIPLALGRFEEQAMQAAELYQRVKADPALSDNITFTGHSLGGGLASVMAVWFDRPAYVFAAAPFQASADANQPTNTVVAYALQSVMQIVRSRLDNVDPSFASYNPATDFASRETNVQAWAIQGELLEANLGMFNWIEAGNGTPLFTDSAITLDEGNKHSIDLHIAGLLVTSFQTQAGRVPHALTVLMDKNLYGGDVLGNQQLIITKLVRNEVGVRDDNGQVLLASNGMLTHFTNDLQKLGTDITGLNEAAQKAIVAQGVEWYYWQGTDYAGQEFSTRSGAVLQYTSAQGANLPGAQDRASSYVRPWLDALYTANTGDTRFAPMGTSFAQWNVATSATTGAVALARDLDQTQMFIGQGGNDTFTGGRRADVMFAGAGNDSLSGGNGNDMLHGGTGDDTLTGGAGNDWIHGGAGADRYEFSGDFGEDTLIDSDGNGSIWINGVEVTGGKKIEGLPNSWISDNKNWRFELGSNGDLLIRHANGSAGSVMLRGWQGGGGNRLGITLEDATAAATEQPTVRTYLGDQVAPLTANTNNQPNFGPTYDWGATTWLVNGTLAGGQAQLNFADVVNVAHIPQLNANYTDSRIFGLGGNDALGGGDGDDTIDGGEGDDLIAGGRGSNVLRGGTGNDFISATGYIPLALRRIRPGDVWTAAPSGSTVLASGPTWGVYETADGERVWHSVSFPATDVAVGSVIDAGAGNDEAIGSWAGDTIYMGEGNDTAHGLAGRDVIYGEGGNDRLYGDGIENTGFYNSVLGEQHGDDLIDGGAGNDSISGHGGADVLLGGDGDDVIDGDGNVLAAYHGNDYLSGGNGLDNLRGNGGNDHLDGGSGHDSLYGDASNDLLMGGTGDDQMQGDSGAQTVEDGDDVLHGEAGNDRLIGNGGNDQLFGGVDNDDLQGDNGPATALDGHDLLDGGEGDDQLSGGGGRDTLYGGAGADVLDGDAGTPSAFDGADFLDGGAGNDTFAGGGGADTLLGGDGNDYLMGDNGPETAFDGADQIDGGDGNDTIYGQGGDDLLVGGAGDDSIVGGTGNDTLDGGTSMDTLFGGDGDDRLLNGEVMQGGQGNDTYEFTTWPTGYASISEDSGGGTDRLKLSVVSTEVNVARLLFNEANSWARPEDLLLTSGHGANGIVVRNQFGSADQRNGIEMVEFSDGVVWSQADLYQKSLTASAYQFQGHNFSDVITMDGVRSVASGYGGNDVINGSSISETIFGGLGNDQLNGGDGADEVWGEDGNDTLVGGSGNDRLLGGAGNDVYRVGRGDGSDRIEVAGDGSDVLELKDGILQSDVHLLRDGNDMVVSIDQGQTQVRVVSHFSHSEFSLKTIRFSDGAVWNAEQIAAQIPPTTANAMVGGADDDQFLVDDVNDTVTEMVNQGIDTVLSSITHTLGANVENLTLTGVIDINGTGNALNNRLVGNSGANMLNGGSGSDTLEGGAGNDFYWVSGADDTVIERADEGIDEVLTQYSFTLPEHVEKLSTPMDRTGVFRSGNFFSGNDQDNTIRVGRLYSNAVIDGGLGADTMISEASDTTFHVDNPSDVVVGSGAVISSVSWSLQHLRNIRLRMVGDGLVGTGSAADELFEAMGTNITLAGQGGDDRYTVAWSAAQQRYSAYIIEVADGGENDWVTITGDAGTHSLGSFPFVENISLDIYAGQSNVLGTDGDNHIYGNSSTNVLDGGAGDDYIRSNGGGDLLIGGSGQDTLQGNGSDTLRGGEGDDVLMVSNNASHDAIILFGLGSGQDRLHLNRDAFGSQCRAVVRLKEGLAAADLSVLREGRDLVLTVSPGHRLTVVNYFNNESDTTNSGGFSGVEFSTGLRLSSSVLLQRMLAGNPNEGTAADDVLLGSGNDDLLAGLGGNDTIWAEAGTDQLYGEEGNDSLHGGTGADLLAGGAGDDYLDGAVDDDFLRGGEGADTLAGGDGADVLEGGAGNDTIVYQTGADTIRFARGDGVDTVVSYGSWYHDDQHKTIEFGPDIAATDVSVSADSGSLTLAISGTGDSISLSSLLGNNMQVQARFADGTVWSASVLRDAARTIFGDDGANVLVADYWNSSRLLGRGGNDSLTGYYGDDELDGGAGADVMAGGYGNDSYWVDNASDVVNETVDQGHDRVISNISYALRSNVEDLELLGTLSINGTGNGMANRIAGNVGNNTLSGGAGADTLQGGLGNDTYVVDNVGDLVTEAEGEGTDLVQSSVSHTLGANVENLTLTGTVAINGTGNALDNVLTGNSAANVMTGGAGNDTYVVGTGDTTVEAANGGIDTVQSSITWTLATNVENLTLTGTGAINGTGNALDNLLTGNSAANVLTGGTGNDTYVVGTGDTTVEAANGGTDTVQSSITWTLATNVENLTLTGTGAINGTGNTLNNLLVGNSGANTLNGGAGNDTLDGGAGADSLVGGTGNDTYWLGRGYGIDTITENDATAGNTDVARFEAGIAVDQLWFAQSGNNLNVSIIGTNDRFTLTNWYLGSQYRVEQFQTSDGKQLLDAQVQNLVSAMAAFSPPPVGQTSLSSSQAASLSPVIAANWQ